jgi:hypothetical protein
MKHLLTVTYTHPHTRKLHTLILIHASYIHSSSSTQVTSTHPLTLTSYIHSSPYRQVTSTHLLTLTSYIHSSPYRQVTSTHPHTHASYIYSYSYMYTQVTSTYPHAHKLHILIHIHGSATGCSIPVCSTYKYSTHSTIAPDSYCCDITIGKCAHRMPSSGVRGRHTCVWGSCIYSTVQIWVEKCHLDAWKKGPGSLFTKKTRDRKSRGPVYLGLWTDVWCKKNVCKYFARIPSCNIIYAPNLASLTFGTERVLWGGHQSLVVYKEAPWGRGLL